jgi:beta-lactamase class A
MLHRPVTSGVFIVAISLILSSPSYSQADSLRQRILNIISAGNAETGVAIRHLEHGDTLSVNGNRHFPMQSVFKFHIALAVLNEVDKGTFSLNQKIDIQKTDLLPGTWSPMRDDHPDGNIKLPLSKILSYTVSQSDNNGCDILLGLVGGPAKVQLFMDSLGITDFSIRANEAEMHSDWNVQFTNWTTPKASVQLLSDLYNGKILSEKSKRYLLKLMTETSTGPARIKGRLPEGTPVAHKTGSSGENKDGITAAVNDIGIVTLPDGTHFAISVFITNSAESNETNEKIIAEIAKATWDYFLTPAH